MPCLLPRKNFPSEKNGLSFSSKLRNNPWYHILRTGFKENYGLVTSEVALINGGTETRFFFIISHIRKAIPITDTVKSVRRVHIGASVIAGAGCVMISKIKLGCSNRGSARTNGRLKHTWVTSRIATVFNKSLRGTSKAYNTKKSTLYILNDAMDKMMASQVCFN